MRQRYSAPRTMTVVAGLDLTREVEVRDPAVYEQLFGTGLMEAAA